MAAFPNRCESPRRAGLAVRRDDDIFEGLLALPKGRELEAKDEGAIIEELIEELGCGAVDHSASLHIKDRHHEDAAIDAERDGLDVFCAEEAGERDLDEPLDLAFV